MSELISHSHTMTPEELGDAAQYWADHAAGVNAQPDWVSMIPVEARTATIDAVVTELDGRRPALKTVSVEPGEDGAIVFTAAATVD